MSLTGLFLCFFLIIHLLGNLQLLLPAAQAKLQFNWYSNLLAGNMLIKIISWVLLASIIAHAVYALLITRHNTKANGTKYVYDKRDAASKWNSRNMGLLGTIILLFLVIHFKDFWYQYDFKELPLDSASNKDMYTVVVETFRQWWYVLIYEAAFIALGFHLLHGFSARHEHLAYITLNMPNGLMCSAGFTPHLSPWALCLSLYTSTLNKLKMVDARIPAGELADKWNNYKKIQSW